MGTSRTEPGTDSGLPEIYDDLRSHPALDMVDHVMVNTMRSTGQRNRALQMLAQHQSNYCISTAHIALGSHGDSTPTYNLAHGDCDGFVST
jgi:hypothetical protein